MLLLPESRPPRQEKQGLFRKQTFIILHHAQKKQPEESMKNLGASQNFLVFSIIGLWIRTNRYKLNTLREKKAQLFFVIVKMFVVEL